MCGLQTPKHVLGRTTDKFNLGFPEVTENWADMHCRNEWKRHQSLKILSWKEWLLPKFFFLCNKLLACAKEQLISNVVPFYRNVLREKKKLGMCAVFFFKPCILKPVIILLLFILKKEIRCLRFDLWVYHVRCQHITLPLSQEATCSFLETLPRWKKRKS